jgi:6-phosphogluconolactonase
LKEEKNSQVAEPTEGAAGAGNEVPAAIESESGAEAPEADTTGAEAGTEQEEPSAAEADASPWFPSPPQVYRYHDPAKVAEAAAKRVLDTARRAVEKYDNFIIVLAGGSTPRTLYERLTESPYRERLPWNKTFFVFGDERCVPPDDESSNYRMVHEALLAPLEIPEHRVFRLKGELDPGDAAKRYEVRLGDLFLLRPKRFFDLALLGIGTDGHTASLFPGTAALEERERWVVANHVPQLDAWRLTLTLPALNSAKRVIFQATGETKARIIAEAFGGVEHDEPYPCELLGARFSRREVLIDYAAASQMPREEETEEKKE